MYRYPMVACPPVQTWLQIWATTRAQFQPSNPRTNLLSMKTTSGPTTTASRKIWIGQILQWIVLPWNKRTVLVHYRRQQQHLQQLHQHLQCQLKHTGLLQPLIHLYHQGLSVIMIEQVNSDILLSLQKFVQVGIWMPD